MRFFYRIAASVSCAALLLAVAFPVQARALTFPTVANLTHGDVFKVDGSSTLYYFGKNDLRYIFPDAGTYFSWYEDFDDVEVITSAELSQIPLGGMVYYKPFDFLLKTSTDSTVYWPFLDGQLAPVQDESAAEVLAGEDWQAKIKVVDPSTLGSYEISHESVIDEELAADMGFVAEFISALFFGPVPTIAENQLMTNVTGVYIYASPERFAATDETEECGSSYCAYNEVTVAQYGTLKFVNDTTKDMIVRDEGGAWSTGTIPANGGIGVVTVRQEPGTHRFIKSTDEDVWGELTVTEEDECGGSYICETLE